MNPKNLPKVEIPDLTLDEMKRLDLDEVSAMANKMRRAVVDESR